MSINFFSLPVSKIDLRLSAKTTRGLLGGFTVSFYSNTLPNRVKISVILLNYTVNLAKNILFPSSETKKEIKLDHDFFSSPHRGRPLRHNCNLNDTVLR